MWKGNVINSIFPRLGILELDLDPKYAEIKTIIKQIISGKSPGENAVLVKIHKYGGNVHVRKLLYLFLMIWSHGQYG